MRHTRPMRAGVIAILAALGLVALPTLAGAASQLTATGVRVTNYPVKVRVVVDFNGTVSADEVEAGLVTRTMAVARVDHPGVITTTGGGSGSGVSVAVQPATQGLSIAMSYAPHKFKYVSYKVLTGNRLAIDLWKSAPPPPGHAFIYRKHCLTIKTWEEDGNGLISVQGTVNDVFENTFRVVLRNAYGKVLGRRIVVQQSPWSTRVKYTSARRQTGTLEVAALSPKDGSLACLYEVRAFFSAS
ncbi:MAG: Immunoglobulin-like domain of bacterial spore germination [Gaiellaceae bacterium]|nr:Immunoglobulin-like domain of bacterial spore germination [Gaiellaceae bacterium]